MTKKPKQSALVQRIIVTPADANFGRAVSAGWIVSQMDTTAGFAAAKVAKTEMDITGLPALTFEAPVRAKDVLSLYAEAAKTSRTTITVTTSAWVRPHGNTRNRFVCEGPFTYATSETAYDVDDEVDLPDEEHVADLPVVEVEPEIEEPVAHGVDLPQTSIQELTPDMVPALRIHLETCWRETYSDRLTEAELDSLTGALASQNLGGLLAEDAHTPLVVTHEDAIVGCIMTASRHNVSYIWGMYIQQAYQRQGLGSALMEAIGQRLPDKGMVELSVLHSSEPARNFYIKLGFKGHRNSSYEFVPGKTMDVANMYATVKTLRG